MTSGSNPFEAMMKAGQDWAKSLNPALESFMPKGFESMWPTMSAARVKLIMIENKFELAKYLKNSVYGKKLIVGMGAGSISSWIRDLPKLIK